MAIGVSIGPVAKKDEGKLAAILRDIDCFGARDKSSLMFAKRHGLNQVYLTYDLALGYLGGGKTDAGTKVGIALHGERYRGRLKSKILDLISGRQEFVLISLDRENSAWVKEIHDDIMSCNKNARISVKSYNGFVDEILGIVLECDVFITSKLHGGISAYALNIPFILEEYHPKCTDFLHDIGWRLDLDAIDSLEEIKVRWRVGITPPDTKQIRAIQSAFPFSG